jgi:hypothetical protein
MKLMINNKPLYLKPERLNFHSFVSTLPKTLPIIEKIKKDLEENPLIKNVKTQLELGEGGDFEFKNELLFYKDLLYVPPGMARLEILQARHDFPSVGHFGYNKILELVSRDYWWPQMWKFVKDYVRSCNICSRAKYIRHRFCNYYLYLKGLGHLY